MLSHWSLHTLRIWCASFLISIWFDFILIYASNWKTLTIDYGCQWLFLNYYFWIKRWAGYLFNFANVLQKIVGFLCLSCIIIARLAHFLHASVCNHIYVLLSPCIPKTSKWSIILFIFSIVSVHPASFLTM